MPNAQLSPIHIFRAGRHTAMNGVVLDFSDADLSAAAAAYDPGVHEAPIVVGHPQHDAPAYGWISGVSFADGALAAHPSQVDADFAEMVRAGRFKKVSASFYVPDSPSNPKPGSYYLRHVGFLGAQPPALKGLKQAEFADEKDGWIEVEFGESGGDAEERLWNRFVDWLGTRLDRVGQAAYAELSTAPWSGDAGKYKDAEAYCAACLVDTNPDGKAKEQAMCHLPVREPSGALNRHALIAAQGALVGARGGVKLPDDVKRAAAKKLIGLMKANGITPAGSLTKLADFTEPTSVENTVDQKTAEQQQAEFAERENALKAREKAIAEAEAKARNQANADFVERLVNDGKVLPRDKTGLTTFLGTLPADANVEFAEDGKQVKTPSADWLKTFLTNLPPAIDYGERAHADNADGGVASFAAPTGVVVDGARAQLHAKAKAYQAKHPDISFVEAVRAVGG